ncbi:MAG: MFS transporter [Chloroflexia bacterium]
MDETTLRRYAILITTLSSFLTPFMSSAVNLALKDIGRDLAADAVALAWVQSAHLLASAACLPPLGRAADLYGRRRVFLAGLLAYGATSLLCALAGSTPFLIAARALQGIGGSMVFGTAVAILTSVFPPDQRGRVLGINTAAVYTGLTLGPSLGGFLTQHLGWRSIFAFAAALVLALFPLALLRLRGEWAGAAGQRFEWAGAVLFSSSLLGFLGGLSSLRESALSPYLAAAGLGGLAVFTLWELRRRENPSPHLLRHLWPTEPILDLRRFRGNLTFIFSNLAALIHYSATHAISFLLSLYLQKVLALPPQQAGLVLLAQPAVMALLSPPAGRLSDRIQPRILASLGMAIMAGGLFALSTLGSRSPIALVVAFLALIGLGYALFSAPNTNAVMGAVSRRDYGVASSTLATMRLTGQAVSMALVTLLVSTYIGRVEWDQLLPSQLLSVMNLAFQLFTGLCLLGILASLARGKVEEREA